MDVSHGILLIAKQGLSYFCMVENIVAVYAIAALETTPKAHTSVSAAFCSLCTVVGEHTTAPGG